MTEIPEDVMIEARRIAKEVLAEIGLKVVMRSEIKVAAAAIMAERERCARIAESFLSHGDKFSQRQAIADRIRSRQP